MSDNTVSSFLIFVLPFFFFISSLTVLSRYPCANLLGRGAPELLSEAPELDPKSP